MAKVYDVAVSFKRSVQPKEYETAVAEVALKAQTEDGDDHVALINVLGENARNGALAMLKGKFDSTSTKAMPTDIAEAKVTPKEEPAAPKSNGSEIPDEAPPAEKKRTRGPNKATKEKEEKAKADASAMPDEDDGPPEPKEPEAASNGAADIPDEAEDWEKESPPETEEPLTGADVQAFITKQVQGSKITVPEVKAILAKFGGMRVADIDVAKLPKVKEAILADSKA